MSEENKYNRIAELAPIDECIREIMISYQESTKVVGWYAHSDEVRGPYCRWISISDVAPEYAKHVAFKIDEARFVSACMNYAPKLAVEFEKLQSQLEACRKERDELQEVLDTIAIENKNLVKCEECQVETTKNMCASDHFDNGETSGWTHVCFKCVALEALNLIKQKSPRCDCMDAPEIARKALADIEGGRK